MTDPEPERPRSIRHQDPHKPFTPPSGKSHLEAITAHVEQHFGKVDRVFHEAISDLVHLDILIVEPTAEVPYLTLVTSGMSELPMTVPAGEIGPRYAELVMLLMPDHPMDQESWQDPKNYWPIRHLKQLARMPHTLDTWLAAGQTVSTDPPEAVAPGVPFCGLGVLEVLDPAARRLRVDDTVEIGFLQVVALHPEELQAKLAGDAGSLAELFDSEVLRVVFNTRPNLFSGSPEVLLARMRRGGRLIVLAGCLLALTSVADLLSCYADGTRLVWGRFAFGLSLAWWVGEGKVWARWVAVVLMGLGVVGAAVLLNRAGFASYRLLMLAASIPIWIGVAVLLLVPPSVRFWYLGHSGRKSSAD